MRKPQGKLVHLPTSDPPRRILCVLPPHVPLLHQLSSPPGLKSILQATGSMQRHPGPAPRSLRRKPGLSNLSLSDLSRPSTTVELVRELVQLETPPRSRTSSRGRPARSVDLSFQQMGFSEMTVYANTSARMQYHISVHMDCFVPSSYITVVKRGNIDGEFVGSFECVLPFSRGRVTSSRAVTHTHSFGRTGWGCRRRGRR